MNNTTGRTLTKDTCLIDSEGFRIVLVVLYAALFFISLMGNILVIIVVYRNKSLRNSANYFIVNMAVSDLFIPILVIPRFVKEIATRDYSWGVSGLSGEILCKIVYFLSDATPVVSILSLMLISCDRFRAVMFPLSYKKRIPLWILISSTWVISFGVLSPHFYSFRLQTIKLNDQLFNACIRNWSPAFDTATAEKNFLTFIIIAFIFVPFIVLSCIYSVISVVMINHKAIGDGFRSEKGRAIRDRKTRTVVKLAFTIVIACAVCYGPFGALLLLVQFKYGLENVPVDCNWKMFSAIAIFLGHSNAAVNPAIYFLYVQNYKKELKRILSYVSRPFTAANSGAGTVPQQLELIEV